MGKHKTLKTNGWDFAGILVSGICVLHCIAIPLILLFLPTFGEHLIPQEDITHVVLLGFILGIAGISFVSGYRVHGKWQPVAWMVVGMFFILVATFFAHNYLGHFWEPILAIIGSLALIRAHYLNHHCKKCEHVHEEQHEHS